MTVARRRTLRAPRSEVWRVMADPYRLPAWWPGVERVEEVTERAWTKVMRAPRGGKAVRADYSLVAAEPERRLEWRHEVAESPFERLMSEARYEFELEPAEDEGATAVRATARIRLRGLSRLGAFQIRRATKRRLDEALESLEAVAA